MRRSLTLIAITALLCAAKPVGKAEDIQRVEEYLTDLHSIVADFNQVDAGGGVAEGKFYLKKPGKMRWEYKPPTPILLVSNGKVMTYYDSELDQVNYIAFDDTLAGFLAQDKITLNSKSAKLIDFVAKEGVIRATIVQSKKPDEGSLTLEFSDKPLQLKQMVVTDARGQRTNIQLQNATYGENLPDSLFKFEDPRGLTKRKRAN